MYMCMYVYMAVSNTKEKWHSYMYCISSTGRSSFVRVRRVDMRLKRCSLHSLDWHTTGNEIVHGGTPFLSTLNH